MIHDDLKDVLYIENGVICRHRHIPMIKETKFEEFKYILLTNENIDNETNNTWDKLWRPSGFFDLDDDDDRVKCICSQKIKYIFYIENIVQIIFKFFFLNYFINS